MPCYNIYKVSKLKKTLHENSISWQDFSEQLQTNYAFIYRLPDGHIALLPNHMLDEDDGILFENEECFNKYLLEDKFPIENPKKNPTEKYQSEVLGVKSEMNEFIKYLANFIGIKKFSQGFYDKGSLPGLLEQVKKKWKLTTPKERLYASLVLGEYLCRVNHAEWMFVKQYGVFNPYFVPAIVYQEGNILLLLDQAHSYFECKERSLEQFANLKNIKTPIRTQQNTRSFEFRKL